MAITLHDSVVVEGRQWYLQKADFSLDGKTFSTYFYALSREHASYMFEAIKTNGQLGDEIVATYDLNSRDIPVKDGEVLVTVAGYTGSGKSAIAGEIEITMKAIGIPVLWANGDAEKNMTGADWLAAIETYRPTVRIMEVNVPRPGRSVPGE